MILFAAARALFLTYSLCTCFFFHFQAGSMALLLLLCSSVIGTIYGLQYDPEQIHLSFGSTNYDDILISWASTGTNEKPSTKPYVTYGSESNKYTSNTTAAVYTYTDGNWTGLLYWAHLQPLEQDTTYFYKIMSPSSTSAEFSFTFKHPKSLPSQPFEFLLVGDMGEAVSTKQCIDTNGCSNDTIAALQREVSTNDNAFLVHVGDIAYTSGDQRIWDIYLNQMQNITATLPYMVCPGNHEHYYNFTGYKKRFNMPGAISNYGESNLYYSWIYGGVYFLAFSSEHDYSVGSAQYEWIKNELKQHANNDDIKWRIMYSHRPIYCSTNDYYDCVQNGPTNMEPIFEPLLKEYEFDLYFAGHLHNYERSYSVYNFSDIVVNEEKGVYMNPEHTVHAVIGMSGDDEGLTDSWYEPQPDWSAFRIAKLGYSKIKVYNETDLEFQLIDSESMEVIDQFVIRKDQ